VFAGASDEDVILVALFTTKERAEQYVKLPHPEPEEYGPQMVPDSCIDVAVLHDGAVWAANDFEITTHDQALAELNRARRG